MTTQHTDVRQIHEATEPRPHDPLGVEATRRIARQIMDTVADPKMHPSIAMKAARAVTQRKISPAEIAEALDSVITARQAGRLRSPGAYFCTILKRLFQYHEVPW